MSSSEEDDLEPIVIDNGTWMCKAGYAGDKTACAYERTVIGRQPANEQAGDRAEYVGEAAMMKRDFLAITSPMERGRITNWEDMEKFWQYIFTHELRKGTSDRPLLITEVPSNDQSNRQKMVEILIEKFEVPSLYVAVPANIALYSSGRSTGMVLDVGGSVTHAVAIFEGKDVVPGIEGATARCEAGHRERHRIDIGGDDITCHIANIVDQMYGTQYTAPVSRNKLSYIEDMKHFLTGLYNLNDEELKQQTFTLPDGMVVKVQDDILACGDALFYSAPGPTAGMGKETNDIARVLADLIESCEASLRPQLLNNVILSGGTTLTPGVKEMVESLLEPQAHKYAAQLKVIAPPERRKSTWLGGSILASLSNFTKQCKTRADYSEEGWTCFTNFDDAIIIS